MKSARELESSFSESTNSGFVNPPISIEVKPVQEDYKPQPKPVKTVKSKIRFYATFSFAFIFICSFSGLMFLVPLVVDPALATISAQFVDDPVQCRVVQSNYILGEAELVNHQQELMPYLFVRSKHFTSVAFYY